MLIPSTPSASSISMALSTIFSRVRGARPSLLGCGVIFFDLSQEGA